MLRAMRHAMARDASPDADCSSSRSSAWTSLLIALALPTGKRSLRPRSRSCIRLAPIGHFVAVSSIGTHDPSECHPGHGLALPHKGRICRRLGACVAALSRSRRRAFTMRMRPNPAVNTDAPSAALRARRGSPVTLVR